MNLTQRRRGAEQDARRTDPALGSSSAPLRLCVRLLFLLLLTGCSEPTGRSVYKNPLDVTVDEKGTTARVVLTGPRTVAVVDLASGKIIEETPWPKDKRMPEAEDIGPFPESYRDMTKVGLYLRDSTNLRAFSWSTKSHHILAVHQIPKTNLPTTQVAQGWVFVNALVFADRSKNREMGHAALQASLDHPGQAFADPAAVLETPDGTRAFVASAGVDSVLAIDMNKLIPYLKEAYAPFGLFSNLASAYGKLKISGDLTASRRYVIAKLPTQSNPRRLGLSGDGKVLVASNYLADSLTVIDAEKLKVVKHISLDGPKPDAARRGEILFNSAKLTFQGQFTCASCHPNGGADGLNWDLTRDGIGNFKNTKSLLGVKDTAPYGWLGTSPTLEDRILGTLRTLHRYEPSEEEVSDLAAHLRSLEPSFKTPSPPAPLPQGGEGREERGKAIFEGKGRCASCHSGPAFDDGKLHDVDTGDQSRDREGAETRFNTPSLLGVARTAPYLHDGRATTLEEVFTKHNQEKRHGDAHQLTPAELADLIAYLKSL